MKFRFWGGDEFAGLQIQRGRARAYYESVSLVADQSESGSESVL
jgi:hypothetical protein